MLERLRIQNFKAWRDTGDIEFAPLTMFFGPNSSGKTSLIQLLLLLQQSAQSSDLHQVLDFGNEHSTVELGSFAEVIHGHDLDASLKAEVTWRTDAEPGFESQRDFEVEIRQSAMGRIQVQFMCYQIRRPDVSVLNMVRAPEVQWVRVKGPNVWQAADVAPMRFYGIPGRVVEANPDFGPVVMEFERLLSAIRYVGPLRDQPRRLYRTGSNGSRHVGKYGEHAVDMLLAAGSRIAKIAAEWLERMGLVEGFEVRPIAVNRREHEILVRTIGGGTLVNLADVGFGISQVLPVIVECYCVEPNSIVIFEQPEIHLHPAAQADLADLFIDALQARENGKPRNVQFIVESHSEHFLRRLQRRIAEQKVDAGDVAMYVCEPPGAHGATLRRLEHDRYGRIANWPKNFFGDVLDDTAQMVRAAFARMRAEKADG
jgi:predicted ATPase